MINTAQILLGLDDELSEDSELGDKDPSPDRQ